MSMLLSWPRNKKKKSLMKSGMEVGVLHSQRDSPACRGALDHGMEELYHISPNKFTCSIMGLFKRSLEVTTIASKSWS